MTSCQVRDSEAACTEADGKDIVLVTLPRPEHGAEAYFVAVVMAGDRLRGLLRT